MSIVDIFSKRQKRLRGDVPDVYSYDKIPQSFRVQVVHIWRDALGDESEYYTRGEVKDAYRFIVEMLCREYGVFTLFDKNYGNRHYMNELINFLVKEQDTEKILDAIELSFRAIDHVTRSYGYKYEENASEIADGAISEINLRFREHGIGYQLEKGEIIRIDSQLLHAEAVRPALTLLSGKNYAGAQQEFLSAYEHYRHSKPKEALNDALKSFESVMKAICDKRVWTYDPKDTSKTLLEICFKKGLVPVFWQQHMSALRNLLESGVPTGRNKLSGHGQGSTPISVPDYIVSYVLHMTAAAIVFLVKAEQDLK